MNESDEKQVGFEYTGELLGGVEPMMKRTFEEHAESIPDIETPRLRLVSIGIHDRAGVPEDGIRKGKRGCNDGVGLPRTRRIDILPLDQSNQFPTSGWLHHARKSRL